MYLILLFRAHTMIAKHTLFYNEMCKVMLLGVWLMINLKCNTLQVGRLKGDGCVHTNDMIINSNDSRQDNIQRWVCSVCPSGERYFIAVYKVLPCVLSCL